MAQQSEQSRERNLMRDLRGILVEGENTFDPELARPFTQRRERERGRERKREVKRENLDWLAWLAD